MGCTPRDKVAHATPRDKDALPIREFRVIP